MLLTRRRSLVQDPDKFPTIQLLLLALVRVAEPIALTSILPYAWKLVLTFEFGDKSDASFYAGLLIAAFSLAESLSGMFWGSLSDRIGRKPVLMMGCLGTIASLLIVGFSSNFWVALAGRFLGGALNGNIGVIQTMVSELVINPAHEPIAYAIMPFVWSVGTIAGPCIGGFFAQPAVNFPTMFHEHSIFAEFPYLLPNLICSGLMLVSIITGWLLLQETHPEMRAYRVPTDLEGADEILVQPGLSAAIQAEQPIYGTFVAPQPHGPSHDDCRHQERNNSGDKDRKVFTKSVIMLTIALGIFTYHSMTYDHLLPIFLQERRTFDELAILDAYQPASLSGGLGLTVQQTGIVQSVNGLIALFVQGVIFPPVASWLGIWRTFVLVTVGHPLAYLVVPFIKLLPVDMVYYGIYASLTLRNLLSILAYPLLLILIKEAAPSPGCLGKINGLSASTGAACRTIASPVAGLLWGIGTKVGFTPIAWWASALVAVLGAMQLCFMSNAQDESEDLCSSMPDSIEQRMPFKNQRLRIQVDELDSGYNSADERTPLQGR